MTISSLVSTKPGKVQAIAILTLVSGITNILWTLFLGIFIIPVIAIATIGIGCLLYPLLLLPIVLGVFEIIYAAKLLPTPIKPVKPSLTIAILEIVCALTWNVVAVAAGIVALILYSEPEVKDYFAKFVPAPAVPPAPMPEEAPIVPAVTPPAPLPEPPVKVAEASVPDSVEPAVPAVAMQPVAPEISEPEPVTPATSGKKPAKVTAKPKPAGAAPKAKSTKPAQAARPKAPKARPTAKPAASKTKKPTG